MPSTIFPNVSQQTQEALSAHVPEGEERSTEDIVSLSTAEERDRKLFMGDINKFMTEIGKPLSKIPIMGYKELDLYQLFKEVTAYGGFIEVVKNVGTWSKIWKRLGNFDPSITDSSFRLKKNYERYLLEYEYKLFPEHRQQAFELEKQVQLKKTQQTSPRASSDAAGQSRKQLKSSDGSRVKTKKGKRKAYAGYKDIVRDMSGMPKMPLNLGDLTVEALGTVIPHSPYITDKHIWPVGFKSHRYFASMVNPDVQVKYTSQILDGGDKPQFVVTAEDDPNNSIISYSPSGAWRAVLKRVLSKGGPNDSRKNLSVSGTLRFGLAHPIVTHLIRELPEADRCSEWSSSPSVSPTLGRKRRSSDEEFSDSTSDDDFEDISKKQKLDYEPESLLTMFASKKDLEDLESAVATLQALKYCAVY